MISLKSCTYQKSVNNVTREYADRRQQIPVFHNNTSTEKNADVKQFHVFSKYFSLSALNKFLQSCAING